LMRGGNRFSEKIMLKQEDERRAWFNPVEACSSRGFDLPL